MVAWIRTVQGRCWGYVDMPATADPPPPGSRRRQTTRRRDFIPSCTPRGSPLTQSLGVPNEMPSRRLVVWRRRLPGGRWVLCRSGRVRVAPTTPRDCSNPRDRADESAGGGVDERFERCAPRSAAQPAQAIQVRHQCVLRISEVDEPPQEVRMRRRGKPSFDSLERPRRTGRTPFRGRGSAYPIPS